MKTLTIYLHEKPEDIENWGITWSTLQGLAEQLGVSEEDVIHVALAKLATQRDELYTLDDGPITPERSARIQALADEKMGGRPFVPTDHLFLNADGTVKPLISGA